MATNITFKTFEHAAIITLDDGSMLTVDPNSEYFLQLADLAFCTVTDVITPESGEHPPSEPDIIDRMKNFWQKLAEEIREDLGEPPAPTPV